MAQGRRRHRDQGGRSRVRCCSSGGRQIRADQVKTVADAIAATKDLFAKGNYTQALADAQALTGKITALGDAAAAKKAELTKNWEDMSAGLPGVVEAIKGRVDILSQARSCRPG